MYAAFEEAGEDLDKEDSSCELVIADSQTAMEKHNVCTTVDKASRLLSRICKSPCQKIFKAAGSSRQGVSGPAGCRHEVSLSQEKGRRCTRASPGAQEALLLRVDNLCKHGGTQRDRHIRCPVGPPIEIVMKQDIFKRLWICWKAFAGVTPVEEDQKSQWWSVQDEANQSTGLNQCGRRQKNMRV